MTLRRKLSPRPMDKVDPTSTRHVVASSARTFALPTVAALLACAAVACSSPNGAGDDGVQPDHPRRPIATSTSTPDGTASPVATVGSKPIIDPDPEVHAVKGEVAPVKPRPVPSTTTPVPMPVKKPPHLGGAVAITDAM